MSDFFENTFRRLSASQEQSLGRAILQAEDAVREAVRGVPCADAILGGRASRAERTRAGAVERLEMAVSALCEAARNDRALADRARHAKKAWDRSHNLRWQLAMSAQRVVRPEARKIAGPLMDEEDLINEGYIGLLRAATRFDPERGIRFATYARWWARAQMTRAIDAGGRPIRLSGIAVEQLRNIRRVIHRFDQEETRWNLGDVAAEVGLTEDRVRELLSQGEVVSLEVPLDDGPRSRSMHDVLADEDATQADEEVGHEQLVRRLREVVHELPDERQRYVIVRRYGLEDAQLRTLSEVGVELGLSRERVRQIEQQALNWLREHGRLGVPSKDQQQQHAPAAHAAA